MLLDAGSLNGYLYFGGLKGTVSRDFRSILFGLKDSNRAPCEEAKTVSRILSFSRRNSIVELWKFAFPVYCHSINSWPFCIYFWLYSTVSLPGCTVSWCLDHIVSSLAHTVKISDCSVTLLAVLFHFLTFMYLFLAVLYCNTPGCTVSFPDLSVSLPCCTVL